MPAATVIGVDADPLLLGLAARAIPSERLQLVEADLRASSWTGLLGLPRPADAFVSTTALHWLDRDQLADVYAEAARALRPGGVLVNGDHLFEPADAPTLKRVGEVVREQRERRAGTGTGEDWGTWWDAVTTATEVSELVAQRAGWSARHEVENTPSYDEHVDLLRAAGFAEVGTIWQCGDDRVLVAVNAGTA
jgi:SAM-dependent methyltransferase